MLATFHALVRSARVAYPVPIAALVDGKCLGGAFELALACNFVIAAPDAVFACPEIKLGVFPPVLAALGPHRLGASWSRAPRAHGRKPRRRTARAHRFRHRDRRPTASTCASTRPRGSKGRFAQRSAFSLRQALAATRTSDGLAEIERQYLERLVPSLDGNEGIDAFLAKRPPAWRDA